MNELDLLFDAAASDRRCGAASVEIRLIDGLMRARRSWTTDDLVRGAAKLRVGQPAMANLRALARRLTENDPVIVELRLTERLAALHELDERLAANSWTLIEGCRRVLSLSRSSAVAAVLHGAWDRGWRGETVIFDGSRTGRGRDQARILAETLGGVHSQPDATMPGWLEGESNLVLIGADAVSPARLVNACGTVALLELAAARSVPVTVIADTGKDLADPEIDEILASGPTAVDDEPGRRWRVFEAAPFHLVTNRIHE